MDPSLLEPNITLVLLEKGTSIFSLEKRASVIPYAPCMEYLYTYIWLQSMVHVRNIPYMEHTGMRMLQYLIATSRSIDTFSVTQVQLTAENAD